MKINDPTLFTLKKVDVVKDGHKYYLDFVYEAENDYSIREIQLKKVRLPIDTFNAPSLRADLHIHGNAEYFLKFGSIDLPVEGGVIEKVIKEKTHEMTLEEIEKKLGYKIKIVSEGQKK